MGMHSASTVLDDIIDELRLKYDSSVGLLDGEAIREIPSLNTLQNLGKLLAKLSASLTSSEEKDQALLLSVDNKLTELQLPPTPEKEEVEEPEEVPPPVESTEEEIFSTVKRERSEDVVGDEEDAEDSIPLAKRRKTGSDDPVPELEEDADEQKHEEEENDKPQTAEEEEQEPGDNTELESDSKDAKDTTEATEATEATETEVTEVTEAIADEASDSKEPSDAKEPVQPEEGAKQSETTQEAEQTEEPERLNSKDDPTPPVQTGSYTQDNDTRLKNPKSEFVTPQTLSESAITELGLFSEENNGLETQGKEYLKKKYGVASYPENDLKRMLPGEIPDMDFSKTKAPSNQVQFSTYQSYIESYFRPFASEDISFVNEKFVIPPGFEKGYDPLTSPYLIPKLGPFYTEVWAEEDAALGSKLSSPSFQRPPLEAYKPKGDTEDLVDEKLLTEDVSCGPLSSRLLSAILNVHEVKGTEEDLEDGDNPSDTMKSETSFLGEDMFGEDAASKLNVADMYKVTSDDTDFHSMEDRLKRELKYIGIFTNTPNGDTAKVKKGSIIDSDDWIINREDDEICAEIRSLQDELKGAVVRNRKRKKALKPVLEEHLAYQEFCTILEDLDKQVDQAYTKRLKAKSKRKKLSAEATNTAQQQTANSGLKSLLEKRTRWISNIGKLFEAPEVMKRIPDTSVFSNQDQSDDEEVDAEVDVVNEEAS